MKKFLYENGLSILLLVITILTLCGQLVVGWHEFNNELTDYGRSPYSFGAYLSSGHYIEAVFENWESEFLQMGLYVILSVSLRQKGSSESKSLDSDEKVDREPSPAWKDPKEIIMHRVPLEEVADAYHIFSAKLDNCIKPILIPPSARQ